MPDSQTLHALLQADANLQQHVRHFVKGERLIEHRSQHKRLWLVLEGLLQLIKVTDSAGELRMDKLGAGEMVGILSYYSGESSFFAVEAISNGKALTLEWEEMDYLRDSNPKVFAILQKNIRANITHRYQRLVKLHLELDRVNGALESERRELQATIEELKRTRERLIQQEKLAMVGSIVPGIAHELNNPAASLARNADYLENMLRALLADADSASSEQQQCWQEGLQGDFPDSQTLRTRQQTLEQTYPGISRSLSRRVAQLAPHYWPQPQHAPQSDSAWEVWLRPFEAARFIQTVRSASHRISRLVQSLRRYSRPPVDESRPLNIADGLRDTLLILNSRLHDVEVSTHFEEVPTLNGIEDELNQVWTNLIVNAVDALGGKGQMAVACTHLKESNLVEVSVSDSGPGVPEHLRESIFEPHFTTKAKGGDFGLGLGLSISKVIMQKHGGTLHVESSANGGAKFIARLPV